nr:SbcC/MukB-like Walker B domain-containing protein [Bacteroides propionicifaciens]
MISLALALGLSSLSSNNLKVESLFIDEGFGSLDMDSLNTAMDALEQLQLQGRKIGVISHVQEMSERIPVQIRLVKEDQGRSRIVIE